MKNHEKLKVDRYIVSICIGGNHGRLVIKLHFILCYVSQLYCLMVDAMLLMLVVYIGFFELYKTIIGKTIKTSGGHELVGK